MAFDEDTSQKYIFEKSTKFLLDGIINGFNATVFAYGATGAGKTYTMLGEKEPGIMGLTFQELFNQIDSHKEVADFKIKLSYVEIYNETIKDLLTYDEDILDLREDPIRGNVVANVSEVIASSTKEVLKLLRIGNKNRT